MTISIILTSANLGPDADQAFFDSWATYVAEHLDEAAGFEVASVHQARFGASGADVISGATEEQSQILRDLLRHALWDAFCASGGVAEAPSLDTVHPFRADYVLLEHMPEHVRASHRAAGNWGIYPANGAVRIIAPRDQADDIVCDDADEYDHIVRDATAEDLVRAIRSGARIDTGDVAWDATETYSYVACVFGDDGEQPGDCYTRVGKDETGLWWQDDGDDDERVDMDGPYATEDEARAAAAAHAAAQDAAPDGIDAATMRLGLLVDKAGEPDPEGAWCVYWETVLDDAGPRERYATRAQAEAAATLANDELRASHPGGGLLCSFDVRGLVDGAWLRAYDIDRE